MRFRVVGLVFAVVCVLTGVAQAQHPDPQQLITREFGKSFTVVPGFTPIFADINNDGQEDAVIVVTSKTPLVDQTQYHYRAIDPYDEYWGWSNPRDTLQFSATDIGPPHFLAIIHSWSAPKAKFLVINLPFDKLALSRVQWKKKAVASIHAADSGGLESDMYWDGKKYKWEPADFSE